MDRAAAAALRAQVKADPKNLELRRQLVEAYLAIGWIAKAASAARPLILADPQVGAQLVGRMGAAIGVLRRNSIGDVLTFMKGFGFEPSTVIDVGVNTGTPGLYEPFPQAKFVLVDPVEENVPYMAALCSAYSGRYIVAGAAAERGTMELSCSESFGGSRLLDVVGKRASGPVRRVPVLPLDEIVTESGPYILKIDVEGAELSVLQGSTRVLKDTEIIIVETRLRPYGAAPDLRELLNFLHDAGFAAYDIISLNYHAADLTLKQVDLVAVKRNGFFRNETDYRHVGTDKNFAVEAENVKKAKRHAVAI